MSYVRLKGLHFFWLTLLQGAPCLEVMGCDTESIAGPGMLKMLIDLKVTNEIHSSEFANSHSMPPNPMETTGRHWFSVARRVKDKSLLLNIVPGRKQEERSENTYVCFKIERVVTNQLRPMGLHKRKSAGFAATNICALYHQSWIRTQTLTSCH